MADTRPIVWAVVIGNYEPPEVLDLFETKEVAAQAAEAWDWPGRALRVQWMHVSRTLEETDRG